MSVDHNIGVLRAAPSGSLSYLSALKARSLYQTARLLTSNAPPASVRHRRKAPR